MMKVTEAIEVLVSTYGDLDAVARGLIVDANELYEFKAEEDTAEAVALTVLKKYTAEPVKKPTKPTE